LAASSQSVSNTTIYVRLKASAAAGSYNSVNISITGGGDDKNVVTAASGNTVTAKTLTITGLTFENKVYDRTTTASATGTAALSGVESGDTANVTLGGTAAYTFASAGVGTSIAIYTTGYSISGSSSGNYSLTQPSGNANITVAPLTVSGASATDRVYNTLTTVAIAGGTLSGVIAGDVVTLGGSPTGTVGTAAPGDGKPVTVTGFSISGASAGNYSLSQPTGLTVNITKASQTILGVATTVTKTFGDVAYSLGASVASGETLSYSSDNSAVATVNSAGLVTIIGAGSANISVSQAGNDNYSVATSATQALTVNKANQTITFNNNLTSLAVGSTTALTATASSGLSVSYAVTDNNIATLSGANLVAVARGLTTVVASQAGDLNYNAATPVTTNVSVVRSLTAGDIALIELQTDDSDEFAFVALSNIDAGTVINFTDNAWDGSLATPALTTNENTIVWTAPAGGVTAGTIVTFQNTVGFSAGTYTGSYSGASTSGDQLIAYTGTASNPTFLYALTSNTWISSGSPSSNTSWLPTGLVNGTNARDFSSEIDDQYYNVASVSGSKSEILASIGNVNNWSRSNTRYTSYPISASSVSVTLPQTITFGSLSSKTYGDSTFALSATANSGLNVSYVSSDTSVATVSGSAVTILKAGSTVITASQAGNSSYSVATSVPQTLTVNRKAVTVTADAKSKTYGSANPTLTFVTSTLVGSETLSGSLATAATTSSSVADSPHNITQGTVNNASNPNYDISFTGATLSILAKAVTVTADAQTKVYGASDPALTYTSDGLVNGDALTGSLSRAGGTAVGTYAISQGTLANPNYNISFTGANFTITAASLASSAITLTPAGDGSYAASATGGASFTYSYAGRNQTSYGPSATAPTGAGFYSVTATATGNYSGSNSADFSITGPMAIADSLTKPADNEPYLIPVSELLTNDFRITSTSGATVTTGLSVSAVTGGAGNTASYNVGDRFIQFTPSSGASDTFTYTVTDGVSTSTATVTVTTEIQAPTFNLQIVKVGTASFAGGNTTVTHDFIGVPNQTYLVEYATDLNGAWTSAGNQSTGPKGSFSVIFTKTGNVVADWNAHMFFRARLVR
jgi:hypothetical protein